MSKALTLCLATLIIGTGMGNAAFAQSGTATKDAASKNSQTSAEGQSANADAKEPAEATGKIILEEDFWIPFRYSFADAVHRAHVDYRRGRKEAAEDQIEQAIMWLKMAKNMTANEKSELDLATAIADLRDLNMFLKRGDLVNASKMDKVLSRAATAIAKHHKFNADAAVAKNDLRLASNHLSAAAYSIKEAARSANHEYGDEVVAVLDNYANEGMLDETVVIEPNKLEGALNAISEEITKLEKKLAKVAK